MEQGSLGELYLTRSVIKHIRKHNKAVCVGSGVGKDYSAIRTNTSHTVQTEAVAEAPYIAWVKALNKLYMSGADVSGVRVNYMLPVETDESALKEYAAIFNTLADSGKVQIIGGHSHVSSAYTRPTFLVEAIGDLEGDGLLFGKVKPDYDIVMVGYTAMLGTNLILEGRKKELEARFASSYIDEGRFSEDDFSIKAAMEVVNDCKEQTKAVCAKVISHGGVYGGLWQLGASCNLGVCVNHRSIPITQETVEICNYFDVNPYMLEGTGAFLVAVQNGDLLVDNLKKSKIKSTVIGKFTEKKDRVIQINSQGEKRYLAPVKGDEIYKVVAAY